MPDSVAFSKFLTLIFPKCAASVKMAALCKCQAETTKPVFVQTDAQ